MLKHIIVLLAVLCMLTSLGCDQEESSLDEAFAGFAATDSIAGVDVGKFDAVTTITAWQIRENETHVLLEGMNAGGDRKFAATWRQPLRQKSRP